MQIAQWTHVACCLVYASLGAILCARGRAAAMSAMLGLAMLAMAVWAAAVAWSPDPAVASRPRAALEILRAAGLVAFWILLMRRSFASGGLGRGFEAASFALFAGWSLAVGLDEARLAATLSLAWTVLGAMCVENLLRNAQSERRWSIKFGAAGFAIVLGYDFLLGLHAALAGRVDETVWAARGMVDALAGPLIFVSALRNPDWRINLHLSRDAAFHSAVALGAGVVILAAALGGSYARSAGGALGGFLQILALALAGFVAAVAALSGRLRSRLRNFIAAHFFSYRYDWRREWLRFIATLADGDEVERLGTRAVRAVADIVDSPGGALWIADQEAGGLVLTAAWNIRIPPAARVATAAAAAPLLAQGEPLRGSAAAALLGTGAPDLAHVLVGGWLIVPLAHRGVRALIMLAAPRAPRELGWEDYALLTTAGRQVASYLAEDAAARELATARQIDSFNRRFAFVVHDVKNMASQIQLLLRNADRHSGDPAFLVDLMSTLRGLATRMSGLLGRLGDEGDAASVALHGRPAGSFDPAAELHALVKDWPSGRVVLDGPPGTIRAAGDAARFVAALGHLVQNAVEASPASEPVRLAVEPRGEHVAIVVADRGGGMDARFLREELFVPFRTTKPSGSGLGAFQARTLIAEMGGSLAVDSAPGAGTSATVLLPRADLQ